jgi:antitoxin ParD1/3/4
MTMATETITVTLPAETVRAIREKVDRGAYASADQVIEEALRLLDEEVVETPEFTAYMREKIRESLDEPGPDIPMEEVFDRLERRLRDGR